jgi:hypothetical protein
MNVETGVQQARPGAGYSRRLLDAGIAAGPFYLVVGVAQGLLREGFDFARHPLSVLANGPWGWIQTGNFVLTGLMVIAAAVGIARVLGKQRALTWWLGLYGVAMIAAAIFPADPVDGFPPGTPEGFPTTISTTGVLHFVSGAIAFASVGFSGLAAAWRFWRQRMMPLALLSLFSGLSVLLGFFGGMVTVGIVGIWFAVVVGWLWLSVVSMRLKTAFCENVPLRTLE